MIVCDLFVNKKISLKEKSLYYFHKKIKNLKNPKKTFLVGFFRWVFLGGFFNANPGPIRVNISTMGDGIFYPSPEGTKSN
jgi:hypothetical protein